MSPQRPSRGQRATPSWEATADHPFLSYVDQTKGLQKVSSILSTTLCVTRLEDVGPHQGRPSRGYLGTCHTRRCYRTANITVRGAGDVHPFSMRVSCTRWDSNPPILLSPNAQE